MQLHQFNHDTLKVSCCGWEASTTYWLAESKEAARNEIKAEYPDETPHGLCAHCMAEFITEGSFEVTA